MRKTQIKLDIPVSFFREGKYFIAYTPALDLSTSGKTYQEAKERFVKVVKIFFEETIQEGTLKEALQELGWQKIKHQWTPPIPISQGIESIQVPFRI